MSCVLRIIGEDFDVDSFILKTGIDPYKVFYKGDPKVKSKPDGKKFEHSGCAIDASEADFTDFKQQVKDVIEFLESNRNKLLFINSGSEIQYAVLDFGVAYNPDKFTQTQYLPKELLKLAADLGIGIEISIINRAND
ncbi:DUF4279 domain-containing protein [Mucilaginibacter sp. OK283]|jgi:hypothetical protein|uniref:DUF4279 domain-containing protein n=1 Tax=Mucilaginibacter sp. OK283 TaxID=1881049 RepID=UPI0008AE004A|nr:DUF4279 domain-containing protein [Mucilaginibacter sp. OK283]SEP30141.1 protein of unknown function [Mucilaginibacter sp. OK283]